MRVAVVSDVHGNLAFRRGRLRSCLRKRALRTEGRTVFRHSEYRYLDGTVGMPYEQSRGAFWALLGPDVDFRRTEDDSPAEPRDPDEVSAYFEGQATGA